MDFTVRVVQPGRVRRAGWPSSERGGVVTVLDAPRRPPPSRSTRRPVPATGLLGWLTTTDHKRIGISYMVTAFVFFLLGGALAEVIRAELCSPEQQVVSAGTLQRALHDARQHHDVPVPRARSPSAWPTTSCRCRSAPGTWRSPGSTPSVLALPVRRAHDGRRVPHRRRRRRLRLDRLHAAVGRHPLARRSAATCGSSPSCSPACRACSTAREHRRHRRRPCGRRA